MAWSNVALEYALHNQGMPIISPILACYWYHLLLMEAPPFLLPDVLQWQHPDTYSNTGDGGSHARAGGITGRGERTERRLQHTTDAGQPRQVSGRAAGPLWWALRRLGGKWMFKRSRQVLSHPRAVHVSHHWPLPHSNRNWKSQRTTRGVVIFAEVWKIMSDSRGSICHFICLQCLHVITTMFAYLSMSMFRQCH